MRARDARALAARWVAEHAAEVPGYRGALLGGSLAWLADTAELPATSDVDVMVVTDDPGVPATRSKRRYGGVLLEATVVPWDQLRSPERVLASYHLAGLLRPGTLLADPTGVTTHVLLTAGLRNPTIRRRYQAVRALLGHLPARLGQVTEAVLAANPGIEG
jgi:hypothetical protein